MNSIPLTHTMRLAALALGALALTPSCSSTSSSQAVVSGWLQPSPVLEQQIQDEIDRLPWTHGLERLEQIRWFAAVGEPAYELLLDLISDDRDHVSAAALAALGATSDRRLVPYILAEHWPEERRNGDLNLERARTLVRLGDWSEVPTLMAGMTDERLYTRALCSQTLRDVTHMDFEYDPRSDERSRGAAIKKWEAWWFKRSGEGLLEK